MIENSLSSIRLTSGIYFDLLNPSSYLIYIGDIAGPLSRICRFGGHPPRFYSVAEHCWQCARMAQSLNLPAKALLAVLLHDAAEAFVGDMVTPLKALLPKFSEIEKGIMAAINRRFKIDPSEFSEQIGQIDRHMLFAERNALFPPDNIPWVGEETYGKAKADIYCWAPNVAEAAFLDMYEKIIRYME